MVFFIKSFLISVQVVSFVMVIESVNEKCFLEERNSHIEHFNYRTLSVGGQIRVAGNQWNHFYDKLNLSDNKPILQIYYFICAAFLIAFFIGRPSSEAKFNTVKRLFYII